MLLPAFSHTDDLLLLSTAEGWHVYTLAGTAWETAKYTNFESAVATLRNEGVIWPTFWYRPWKEMSPMDFTYCFFCWCMRYLGRFGVLPSRAASRPREVTNPLSKPTAFLQGRQLCITWHWLFLKLSLICIHPQFNISPAGPWASISTLITWPEELIWVSIITSFYARVGHYPHCLLMS